MLKKVIYTLSICSTFLAVAACQVDQIPTEGDSVKTAESASARSRNSVQNTSECKPAATRIVGGSKTSIEDHPWQIALRVSAPGGDEVCGGSVIRSNWILTAAHCLENANGASDVSVSYGETKWSEANWQTAADIFRHPNYNTHDDMDSDVALVKLASPIAFGNQVSLIPRIPSTVEIPGTACLSVTGWGATIENGWTSDVLREARVPLVERSTCLAAYSDLKWPITGTMLCAGYPSGGTDSCQGDSGGPLVWPSESGINYLVGVVSFGRGCARKSRYGIYAKVDEFESWIDQTMNSNR